MSLSELKRAYRAGSLPKPEYIQQMHAAHTPLYEYAEFIRDTNVGRIEITDGRIVMVTRDPEIRLIADPRQQRLVGVEILNFGAYEKPELDMLRRIVREGDTVLDVGANVGWYTMVLCTTVAGVNVHSFEPVLDTYQSLIAHLALNGIKNAVPHNFGFSREAGSLEFYLPRESGNASAANLSGQENVRRVAVEVRRMDDFVLSEGLEPDFIKCDVEGAELFVFQGAKETLSRYRPAVLSEMLRKWSAPFGYHPNDIIALMAGLGYGCFVIRGEWLEEFLEMDDSTVDTNFLFLHAERHAGVIANLTGH